MSRVPTASPRKTTSPISSGLVAMEARSVDAIPRGAEWQYEPKWDGFRCLLSRNAGSVTLRSKSGEDLTRYFPELAEAALRLKATQFTLDGEIVVPHGKTFSFDDLLQRIHPARAASRNCRSRPPRYFWSSIFWRRQKTRSSQRNRSACGGRRWKPSQRFNSGLKPRFGSRRRRQALPRQKNGWPRPAAVLTA